MQKIFHLVAFFWYAFVVQSLYAKGDEDLPPGIFVYGGPWKYLTFLNLVGELLFCDILNTVMRIVMKSYESFLKSLWQIISAVNGLDLQ